MIIMIAAVAENNALGKDNDLVWHLPNDFKRFKTLTSGHHIIMGRKTFESFPKPLPNRTHVIITRQKNYKAEGCIIVDSIEKALEICPKNEDTYIIGGGEIYTLSLPFADNKLSKGQPVSLKNYFLRRVTRLEPTYIITLLLYFLSVQW